MKRVIFVLLLIPITMVSKAQDSISLFSMISSHENVSLKDNRILAIPTLGPYLMAGNKLYALDDDCEAKTISFPENAPIDDMVWNDDDFIIKSGNRVYSFKNITSPRLEFETDDFMIFPCEEDKIYVVSRYEGMSYLYMANLKLKKAQRMVNLHGEVMNVAKRGTITWITTNECIYRVEGDKCDVLFRFQKPVNSVAMVTAGLLFATDEEIGIVTGKNRYLTLLKSSNHGVVYDGEWLYIITDQYDLVRCHSVYINAMLMLIDALSEEE